MANKPAGSGVVVARPEKLPDPGRPDARQNPSRLSVARAIDPITRVISIKFVSSIFRLLDVEIAHRLVRVRTREMHIDPYIVLGSAIIGLLVGMTGAGGGALMTPMLILLFGVTPSAAISSDLVAAVVMRPIGAAVHWRAGTVNRKLVVLMASGSVPAAIAGAYLLHLMGNSSSAQTHVETILGAALLAGAGAMVLRYVLDRSGKIERSAAIHEITPRPLPTFLVGIFGGLIVGMTSVGSGSLMIVLLLFLYPLISAKQLVGTDLTQAVPLTAAAALGALLFGTVEFGVTISLIIGSVPAVLIGSMLSSTVPDRYIRPVIAFVIFASGLKYIGLSTTVLGWTLFATLLLLGTIAVVSVRVGRRSQAETVAGDRGPPLADPALSHDLPVTRPH
jgi:uncharacterized protein